MAELRETSRVSLWVVFLGWCLLVTWYARSESAVLTLDEECGLADAIEAANTDAGTGGCPAGSGADEIHLTGEVVLTPEDTGGADGGLPWITSAIIVRGFGHAIIRADGATPDKGVLRLTEGASVELEDLTLEIRQPSVGAGIDGASGSRVVCVDRTTAQQVSIELGGRTSWGCLAAGLEVSLGDRVQQMVSAAALQAEVGGWATGLTALTVRCVNDSSGESVRLWLGDEISSWSCSASGLIVTPGDELKLVISGIVE